LKKEYNKLWVFGDSYSTPHVCDLDPQESFWGLTAQHLGINKIANCSRPQSGFDSVAHLVVNMQHEYDWRHDLFLIGLPILERVTMVDNENKIFYGHNYNENWAESKFQINCHYGLSSFQNFKENRGFVLYSNREWTESQALRNIYFLTHWLDSKKANYLIVNLSHPLGTDNARGFNVETLPYCKNHSRCILFDNTYYSINFEIHKPADYDRYGWNGHHGPDGNRHFFEKSVLPTLQRNKLC
jgi:hypothetical protein